MEKNSFYDSLITRLNNQINDLTTKYKQSLVTIQDLQTELEQFKIDKGEKQ